MKFKSNSINSVTDENWEGQKPVAQECGHKRSDAEQEGQKQFTITDPASAATTTATAALSTTDAQAGKCSKSEQVAAAAVAAAVSATESAAKLSATTKPPGDAAQSDGTAASGQSSAATTKSIGTQPKFDPIESQSTIQPAAHRHSTATDERQRFDQ